MAKKFASSPTSDQRISGPRAGRLYRLLKSLSRGPMSRPQLLKRLKVGMRTFYRDVDLLRECGIVIEPGESGYALETSLDAALSLVPFPNPQLTFGDVVTLMKGRSASHRKLRHAFDGLVK